MKINFLAIYKGAKTAAKLYGAYRDYKQMRKYGYDSRAALMIAASEAGINAGQLFDHVQTKSNDLGDITKSDLRDTMYGTKLSF